MRVVEGREPPSLRAIFRGRLTVLSGEAPAADDATSGLPSSFLLRVDGAQNHDTRSVQVGPQPHLAAANCHDIDDFPLFQADVVTDSTCATCF